LTATTNPEHDVEIAPLVAPVEDTVLYMSRRSDLRLTMKARYPMLNPITGQREGMTRGIFCGFREGALRVPKTGKVMMVDTLDGGEFEMDAEPVHEWLTKHRRYGDMNEGFWRVDPVAPPATREEFARISEAGAGWDRETLQEIIRQESEGWGREDVLRVARGTIARIDQLEEQVQARAAEVANEEVAAERAAREKAEKAAADAEAKLKAAKAK
jgi:hypothetical protein